MEQDRLTNLTNLADAIRALTEPSTHTEYIETSTSQTVTTRRGTRTRRVRRRVPHKTTRPGLLTELQQAAVPGTDGTSPSSGGFESRPSADLQPLSVLREIQDDAAHWRDHYKIKNVGGLATLLSRLVSQHHTDHDLAELTWQAQRWVRRASVATGFDPAPVTLGDACPYCARRNSLTITPDLTAARCNHCHTSWNPNTIGLLADMLRANQTVETMTLNRCWMADCVRRGPHDAHRDHRGREWAREDRCVDEHGRPDSRSIGA